MYIHLSVHPSSFCVRSIALKPSEILILIWYLIVFQGNLVYEATGSVYPAGSFLSIDRNNGTITVARDIFGELTDPYLVGAS